MIRPSAYRSMKKTNPAPYKRIELWVKTTDGEFRARTIDGPVYEAEIKRPVRDLAKFLGSRFEPGMSVEVRRFK